MAEYNKEKIIERIFDPNVSVVLAELESGGKELAYLAEKIGISENEIKNRLAYLIECGLVKIESTVYSVDADKLAKVMESDENYENVMDGLTKLDSYLN
jgi:predicted ArsR family transcriptional regulator